MTLRERLDQDMKLALKGGEKLRLSTIRMLRSEIRNSEIDTGKELDEQGILGVLSRYARKRKDSAQEYRDGGREDLYEKEMAEHEVVTAYLPAGLSEAELTAIVDEVIAELSADGMKQMGAVMKIVLEQAAGRADGAQLSGIVKSRLSS